MADKTLSIVLSGKDELSTKLDAVRRKFESVTESGKPLNTRINAIKKQMEDLSQMGAKGSPLWDAMSKQAQEYRKQLDDIREATSNISKGDGAGMSNPLKSMSGVDLGNINGSLGTLGSTISNLVAPMGGLATAIEMTAGFLIDSAKSAADFEEKLDSLQALTGLGAEEMGFFYEQALEMSLRFRSSAGDIVEGMKVIGSQAPELLKCPEALQKVTESALVLSEAAGIDSVDAAKALTGTMNQMGATASQCSDIINVFAASSQQGAADVAYLNRVFEKAGTTASQSGMDYVQLAAMVEAIGPNFGSADEAGTQLSSTLLKLATQTNDKFKPSVVGMAKALDNLAAAELNDEEKKKLVGEGGYKMLSVMLANKEAFKGYTQSLVGTETAYEQMAINQDNMNARMQLMANQWEALKIKVGQSTWMASLCEEFGGIMDIISVLIDAIEEIMLSFELFDEIDIRASSGAMMMLNLLVETVQFLGEVITVVIRLFAKFTNYAIGLWQQGVDWLNNKWTEFKNNLSDNSFVNGIIKAFNKIMDAGAKAVRELQRLWNKLKEWLGMEVAPIVGDAAPQIANEGDQSSPESTVKSGSTSSSKTSKKKGKTSKSKTTKTDYVKAKDDGSLDMAQKKLSAFETKLKETPANDAAALANLRTEVEKWRKTVEERKLLVSPELKLETDSYAYFADEIEKLNNKRKLLLQTKCDPAALRDLDNQIARLKEKQHQEAVRLGIEPDPNSLKSMEATLASMKDTYEKMLEKDTAPSAVKAYRAWMTVFENLIRKKKISLGIEVEPTITKWDTGAKFGLDVQDKKESNDNARSNANEALGLYNAGLIDKKTLQSKLTEINEALQKLGLEPIELKFEVDTASITSIPARLAKLHQQLSSMSEGVGSQSQQWINLAKILKEDTATSAQIAGAALTTAGNSLKGIGGEGAIAKAGAVAAAIGQIILGFTTASVEAAKLGPFGWLAFLGAGLGSLAATIGTIKGFAGGGVIEGNVFHGDATLARVNAGEMILNRNQQANLFRMLDGAGAATPSIPRVIDFRISGADLVATVDTYNDKMSNV